MSKNGRSENDNNQDTVILRNELIIGAVRSSVNDRQILDKLRRVDREQISGILKSEASTRLLLTGFSSFGGTSLVRGIIAKLMDNFTRSRMGKVLVIRLETSRGVSQEYYKLFINENDAGLVSNSIDESQLLPIVETVLVGQPNTISIKANISENTFSGLTSVFDQESKGEVHSVQSQSVTKLVCQILRQLDFGQGGAELRQALNNLFSKQLSDERRQIILVIDRIDKPEPMDRLLNSVLLDSISYPWLSVIVISRREEMLNHWSPELNQRVLEKGFQIRYLRRLWEKDIDLTQELRHLMQDNPLISDKKHEHRLDKWFAHLKYEARGSMALALKKLKLDWLEKDDTLVIDLPSQYMRDRESIEHNAYVQKILEENWDRVIGNLVNSPEIADQARIGIYFIIDWMRAKPIFTWKQLETAAPEQLIPISSEEEVIEEVLRNLLAMLEQNRYLKYQPERDRYKLTWQRHSRLPFFRKSFLLPSSRKSRIDSNIQKEEKNSMAGFNNGYALIVGIANYPKVNKLPKTVLKDAQDVHDLLRSPKYCGYREGNVQLLLDEQATAASICDGLRRLAATGPGDTVLIFFSGHGGRLESAPHAGSYLIPYDCEPNDMPETAISGELLTSLLRDIHAQRLLVIFDSCYSGGAGNTKALGSVQWNFKAGLDETYYEGLAQGTGRVVLASSRQDEVSLVFQNMENSLFTHYMLQALRGSARTRGDGLIRVFDVFDYVSEEVPAYGAQQHPIFKANDLENNFPIALYLGGKGLGSRPRVPQPRQTKVDKRQLRETIVKTFALEDLAILCADIEQDLINDGNNLQVNLDVIGGDGLRMKVLKLIEYLEKRECLAYLVAAVRRERPGII